ncbi:NPP1 family protein [Celerinatantimonas sp. YJH-8]|uniref:NPP1 family protein n=1 Tax=Celerinatantimonas sp. YJH-8 TaxID=3228714 RepID=UPI0038C7B9A2
MRVIKLLLFLSSAMLSIAVKADNFQRLDEALPDQMNITAFAPVFDFDSDSCLPSAGISRSGVQNGGLNPSGSLTGGCRNAQFLQSANSYHRYACLEQNGHQYCGHFFALYFLKDQVLAGINSGHRHDWEQVAIWTEDGRVVYGGYSAHGDMYNLPAAEIPQQNGHLKFVYHKDGVLTHAFRFAKTDENAENPYGQFVTPIIVNWYQMSGDSVANEQLRQSLNAFDYGNAIVPIKDSNFLTNLNRFRPASFPEFTRASVTQSR